MSGAPLAAALPSPGEPAGTTIVPALHADSLPGTVYMALVKPVSEFCHNELSSFQFEGIENFYRGCGSITCNPPTPIGMRSNFGSVHSETGGTWREFYCRNCRFSIVFGATSIGLGHFTCIRPISPCYFVLFLPLKH